MVDIHADIVVLMYSNGDCGGGTTTNQACGHAHLTSDSGGRFRVGSLVTSPLQRVSVPDCGFVADRMVRGGSEEQQNPVDIQLCSDH